MTRAIVVVEGATEETFVSEVLAPHLSGCGVFMSARRIGKPGHKGGRVNFQRAMADVLLLLKGDPQSYCTTLFDYYGLGKGFPRTDVGPNAKSEDKARSVEQPFHEAAVSKMGHTFHPARFIPYLQMHEFEGLLFSDPAAFASAMGKPELQEEIAKIRASFLNPEEIDDGPTTAPSKRVLSLAPDYDKVYQGNLAALEIGLDKMRGECPRFDAWVSRLEALATS